MTIAMDAKRLDIWIFPSQQTPEWISKILPPRAVHVGMCKNNYGPHSL
eukprot:CAMPEP_0172327574 /NCGR_PEP_ID=MMETSP1058-20130122/59905_1 /TAXON_ID=83371 /ORGANISM="Detonula confervacea, Strain CCMP 353" /LENGTH=47 /DNA_ID= /DNA_START= /DNA_END= /DNA_ORIENTATION=